MLLRDGSTLPHKARWESWFAQKTQEPLAPLQEHLTMLYEGSAEGGTEDEKKVIHWLLLKHQEVFS